MQIGMTFSHYLYLSLKIIFLLVDILEIEAEL